jgi:hypothetical protein
MKQILQVIILCSLLSFQIHAQDLVFSPEPVEVIDYADPNDPHFELVAYSTLTNTGSETLSISWDRFIDGAPYGWNIRICDNVQCYEEPVYSNMAEDLGVEAPVTLMPGESTNIDVHIKPKGLSGDGDVRVDVSVIGDADGEIAASNTYTFRSLVTNVREAEKIKFDIYPNPTSDYFQIKGTQEVDRVVIYNIVGKEVRAFDVAPGMRYDLHDLPNGLYLASLMSNEKGILKTLRLAKRSRRP